MEELLSLADIDWLQVAIGVVAAFLFFKFVVTSYEWFATKYGFETKKMREKREDHELLIKTAQNLAALQETHKADDKKHQNDDRSNGSRFDHRYRRRKNAFKKSECRAKRGKQNAC